MGTVSAYRVLQVASRTSTRHQRTADLSRLIVEDVEKVCLQAALRRLGWLLHLSLRWLSSTSSEVEEVPLVGHLIFILNLVRDASIAAGGKIVEVKACRLLFLFLHVIASHRFRLRCLSATSSTAHVEVGDVLKDIELLVHFELF